MSYDLEAVAIELNSMVTDQVVAEYAIGGAVAANVYGEVADTNDVDVFVMLKTAKDSLIIDPTPVIDYFRNKGFVLNNEGYVIIGGWHIQFLPPPSALEEEALSAAISFEDDDLKIRVFTLEHLAAIALKTSRAKDRSRLIAMREQQSLDISSLELILKRHHLEEEWKKHEQLFPIA